MIRGWRLEVGGIYHFSTLHNSNCKWFLSSLKVILNESEESAQLANHEDSSPKEMPLAESFPRITTIIFECFTSSTNVSPFDNLEAGVMNKKKPDLFSERASN